MLGGLGAMLMRNLAVDPNADGDGNGNGNGEDPVVPAAVSAAPVEDDEGDDLDVPPMFQRPPAST
ncbi:MAG: hypothetical protein R2699_07380 [Acidimicrobiales bacterium]